VTLRTGGLPDTIPATFEGADEVRRWLTEQTATDRVATPAEVGALAAFAVSDLAHAISGTPFDPTGRRARVTRP
jgi:3-oxoacyl-[acyl-carrier protein] reductase